VTLCFVCALAVLETVARSTLALRLRVLEASCAAADAAAGAAADFVAGAAADDAAGDAAGAAAGAVFEAVSDVAESALLSRVVGPDDDSL